MSSCAVDVRAPVSSSQKLRIDASSPSCSSLAGVELGVKTGGAQYESPPSARPLATAGSGRAAARCRAAREGAAEFGPERRDPPDHVVVQLPREPDAFLFVHVDQASTKVAQLLLDGVTLGEIDEDAKHADGFPFLGLCPCPSPSARRRRSRGPGTPSRRTPRDPSRRSWPAPRARDGRNTYAIEK